MSAESTVPSPAGQSRELGPSPVSVLPQRDGTGTPGCPPGVRAAAGLPAAAARRGRHGGPAGLTGPHRRPHQPLLAALLVAASLLLRPGRTRPGGRAARWTTCPPCAAGSRWSG
ncbi:hypothetical protein [Streptomyces lienomycini]|uniref:hypothetical protein n=1 Tax=Streptomyces lienomycini TaxID=284035 RepID=UPI0038CDAC17